MFVIVIIFNLNRICKQDFDRFFWYIDEGIQYGFHFRTATSAAHAGAGQLAQL